MIYRAAIDARWCKRIGHCWSDLRNVERHGGRLHFQRSCGRCGKVENHVSTPSVAGTEKKAVGW